MRLIAVIDSSCLINLIHLELAENLELFFTRIYIPRVVHGEVSRKSRFRYRVKKLYARGVFQKCLAANATNVQLLLDQLHEGEAEALVQGSETGARVFIADETAARKNGEHRGMKAVGTASLLARLALEGLAPETHSLIRRLRRDLDFRITDTVVADAIRHAREPII